ncbi:MAG: RNA polymerase sigma factor [Terracidiphilus sp.]
MSNGTAVAERIGLNDRSVAVRALVVEPATCSYEEKLAAYLRIAKERRRQLMWMAQRMTNNHEDAEEIVQEALLRAFKNLARFRGESKMGTWLCVIVQNIWRERLRKQKGIVCLPLERTSNDEEHPLAHNFPDPGRNPEQHCENRELENILLSEINRMSSICKRTIQMCALEELSQVEVANALGVNVFTVKSRLFNGRRMLKRAMCLRTGMRNGSSRTLEAMTCPRKTLPVEAGVLS